jgi:hypothetical protein
MPGRGIGAFAFVDEAITMDLGDVDYVPAELVIWRNGRIGQGRSSRSGLNVYDTVEFEKPTDMTLDDLIKLIKERVPKDYSLNARYYKGDHWQNGNGWSGPMPPKSDLSYSVVFDQVKRAFRSKNAIKEVVRRHVMAAIGKEPAWYYIIRDEALTAAPTVSDVRKDRRSVLTQLATAQRAFDDAQQTPPTDDADPAAPPTDPADPNAEPVEPPTLDPLTEAIMRIEQAVTSWWEKRKITSIMQEETTTALLGGRGMLRLFIPSGAVDKRTGTLALAPSSFKDALEYIFVHEVALDQGAVLTEQSTMQEVGVYAFARKDGSRYGEMAYLVGFGEEAQTIVATVNVPSRKKGKARETEVVGSTATYELGGRLPMFEITREALITPQVREQQAAINEACTMARVNGQTAGFLERTILNGQVPGYYVKNGTTGKQEFVRTEYQTGAGSINFIAGVPLYDENGVFKGLTTPQIVYKDPTPPSVFDETKLMAYRDLLDEVDQTHHLMVGDKYVSAESRKQSRADFITSLRPTRTRLNEQGQWLLETLYALAYNLLDDEVISSENLPAPTELSAVFTTLLDAGPATAEETRAAIEKRTAKLQSRQSTQMEVGIEDTDAENALIAQEEAQGVPWPGSGAGGQPSDGGRTAGSLSSERMQKDDVRTASEEQA